MFGFTDASASSLGIRNFFVPYICGKIDVSKNLFLGETKKETVLTSESVKIFWYSYFVSAHCNIDM
jgi:hypothetical protein